GRRGAAVPRLPRAAFQRNGACGAPPRPDDRRRARDDRRAGAGALGGSKGDRAYPGATPLVGARVLEARATPLDVVRGRSPAFETRAGTAGGCARQALRARRTERGPPR